MDGKCMRWLGLLLWITGAKIVVSSAWRRGEIGLTKRRMLERGFVVKWHHRIIAETPDVFTKDGPTVPRGYEIKKWLYTNGYPYDFKDYVILDDDSDMLYRQRDNYVRTNPYFGLSLLTFAKVLKVFYFNKNYFKLFKWKLREVRVKIYLFLNPKTLRVKS